MWFLAFLWKRYLSSRAYVKNFGTSLWLLWRALVMSSCPGVCTRVSYHCLGLWEMLGCCGAVATTR